MNRQILIREAIMEQRQEFARDLERFERMLREMAGYYEGETKEILNYLARRVKSEAQAMQCLSSAAGW